MLEGIRINSATVGRGTSATSTSSPRLQRRQRRGALSAAVSSASSCPSFWLLLDSSVGAGVLHCREVPNSLGLLGGHAPAQNAESANGERAETHLHVGAGAEEASRTTGREEERNRHAAVGDNDCPRRGGDRIVIDLLSAADPGARQNRTEHEARARDGLAAGYLTRVTDAGGQGLTLLGPGPKTAGLQAREGGAEDPNTTRRSAGAQRVAPPWTASQRGNGNPPG